jgi:hypothetical protein
MQKIEIWTPKYSTNSVLIAKYKVGADNLIVFTKAKHLAGFEYRISGEVYVVPFDSLERVK